MPKPHARFPLSNTELLKIVGNWKGTQEELANRIGMNPNSLRGQIYRARREAISQVPYVLQDDIYPDEETAEDILEEIRLSQKIQARIDPIRTHGTLTFDDSPVAFLLAGCFQLGGRYTNHEWIRVRLDELFAHERLFAGTLGDEIENFHERGFAGIKSSSEMAIVRTKQRILFEWYLDKFKDKIKWAVASQHGTIWDDREAGYSPIKQFYMERQIPFYDGQAYLKVHIGNQTYNLAVAHEFPGASMWNVVHAQKRANWQRFPNADAVIQADKHQYGVLDTDVYGNEVLAGNRASTQLCLIQVGTAKDGPDPYSIRGWERGTAEWPFLVLEADRHRMHITRDIELVLYLLDR